MLKFRNNWFKILWWLLEFDTGKGIFNISKISCPTHDLYFAFLYHIYMLSNASAFYDGSLYSLSVCYLARIMRWKSEIRIKGERNDGRSLQATHRENGEGKTKGDEGVACLPSGCNSGSGVCVCVDIMCVEGGDGVESERSRARW